MKSKINHRKQPTRTKTSLLPIKSAKKQAKKSAKPLSVLPEPGKKSLDASILSSEALADDWGRPDDLGSDLKKGLFDAFGFGDDELSVSQGAEMEPPSQSEDGTRMEETQPLTLEPVYLLPAFGPEEAVSEGAETDRSLHDGPDVIFSPLPGDATFETLWRGEDSELVQTGGANPSYEVVEL